MDILEQIQQWATKITKRLKHLSYKERLRKLGDFNLEKAQRDLIIERYYLMGGVKKMDPDSVSGPQ